ncbi:MAG: hypothetical protein ACR2P4_09815 [Gammaproteobacteria bacterium]
MKPILSFVFSFCIVFYSCVVFCIIASIRPIISTSPPVFADSMTARAKSPAEAALSVREQKPIAV